MISVSESSQDEAVSGLGTSLSLSFRSFRRAVHVEDGLHLFQLHHSVEHSDSHTNNENADKPLLDIVGSLAIGDIAANNQRQHKTVNSPVRKLRHYEVQRTKASQFVNHERQNRHSWQ